MKLPIQVGISIDGGELHPSLYCSVCLRRFSPEQIPNVFQGLIGRMTIGDRWGLR
jgi:hypothetical protein